MPWSYKTDLHNTPEYLSMWAVQKLFTYLLYLFSKCWSHCKFIKNGKLPLYYLMCLAYPQISSKDSYILHPLMDRYLLYRYDQYKDWHWMLLDYFFFIINLVFCHLNYFVKLFSWKSPMNIVTDYFYILDSISSVSTTFIQFFTWKMYPKYIKKIEDVKKKTSTPEGPWSWHSIKHLRKYSCHNGKIRRFSV